MSKTGSYTIHGGRVKELMTALGLNPSALANKCGKPVTLDHLMQIIKHETSKPADYISHRLAKGLGTTLPYLTRKTDDAGPVQVMLAKWRQQSTVIGEALANPEAPEQEDTPVIEASPARPSWQDLPTLGARLALLRGNNHLTTVAKVIGKNDHTAISKYEHNHMRPSRPILEALCTLYDVTVEDILAGTGINIDDLQQHIGGRAVDRAKHPDIIPISPIAGATADTSPAETSAPAQVVIPVEMRTFQPDLVNHPEDALPAQVTMQIESIDEDDVLLATISALRREVRGLKAQAEAVQDGKVAELQAALEDAKKQVADLTHDAEGFRIGRLKAQAEVDTLHKRLHEIDALNKRLEDADRRYSNLNQELVDVKARATEAQRALQEAQKAQKAQAMPEFGRVTTQVGGALLWEDDQWSIPMVPGIMLRKDFRDSADPLCMVWHPLTVGSDPVKLRGPAAKGFVAAYRRYSDGGYQEMQDGDTR